MQLVRDPGLANKLASQGYAMVLERFTWSNHVGEIYQTMLSAMKSPLWSTNQRNNRTGRLNSQRWHEFGHDARENR